MTGKKYREKGWLNQSQMAQACGLSVSGFMRWNVEPVARVGRYTYYSVGDVTENRLKHHAAMLKKKAASATEQNLLIRQEKLRLMQLQTEGQRLKNAELREQLIDVDLLMWTLDQVGKAVARELGKIPAALRKKCPKLTAAGHKIIRREIEKCQTIAVQAALNLDLGQFEAK